jgi:hypothetical protein
LLDSKHNEEEEQQCFIGRQPLWHTS